MRRRLFIILSAVSLVVCLTNAATWVRTYENPQVRDAKWYRAARDRGFACWLADGRVWAWRASSSHPISQEERLFGILGFECSSRVELVCPYPSSGWRELYPSPAQSGVRLSIPCWFLCAVTSVLPAIWLWRYRRDRRLRSDGMPHCVKCDYNLTGNVSGICPECGTPIPADLVRKPIT